MTTAETLQTTFSRSLDAAARVRVRRPDSLFQIELPAFLRDGDAAGVYVRPGPRGRLMVTDIGTTRMRLSYARPVTAELDAALRRLAEDQGLSLDGGELHVEVDTTDLVPAALGLIQVQAQAEAIAATAPRRAREAARFREQALSFLHTLFGGQVQAPYFDPAADPEGLYAVDALVQADHPLAIALVPADIDAERAVAAKLALAPRAGERTRWVAIPRDIERLSGRTRKRLIREYLAVGAVFEEERPIVEGRLRDLAA